MRIGQIIVTEGERDSLISQMIAHHTGSWATHTFLVSVDGWGIEARFPFVRLMDVEARLDQLRCEDRAYVVLDIPELTEAERAGISLRAWEFLGRWYDIGQALLFILTGQFWKDGDGTLTCSRLITASYFDGASYDLFSKDILDEKYPATHPRVRGLQRGYATPADLLTSRLEVVDFHPSSRIQSVADLIPTALRSPAMIDSPVYALTEPGA